MRLGAPSPRFRKSRSVGQPGGFLVFAAQTGPATRVGKSHEVGGTDAHASKITKRGATGGAVPTGLGSLFRELPRTSVRGYRMPPLRGWSVGVSGGVRHLRSRGWRMLSLCSTSTSAAKAPSSASALIAAVNRAAPPKGVIAGISFAPLAHGCLCLTTHLSG